MVGPTVVACLVLLLIQVVKCDEKVNSNDSDEPQITKRSTGDDADIRAQALLRKILQYARPSPAPRGPGEDNEKYDPTFLRVQSSPEYQRLLDSPAYRTLRTNPDFQHLLNNPDYQRLRDNLVQRGANAGLLLVSRPSGVDNMADYINANADNRLYGLVQIFRPQGKHKLLEQLKRLGLGPKAPAHHEESEEVRRLSTLLKEAREKSLGASLPELLQILAGPHHSLDHGHQEHSPLYMPIVQEAPNSVSVVCDHQVTVPNPQNVAVEGAAPGPQNNTEGKPAPAVQTHDKDAVLGKMGTIDLIHYLADRIANEENLENHGSKTELEEKESNGKASRRLLSPEHSLKPHRKPAGSGEKFFQN